MTDAKKPNMAQAIMGNPMAHPLRAPTVQAGWDAMELSMRGRKWPETVIEIARQSYFGGAGHLFDIITSMPVDANVVGRVHQALATELRAFDQEMVQVREARKALNQPKE